MTCEDLNDALADCVDGRLDSAAQRDVERHLEVCVRCAALVTDLRTIRSAAYMLDRLEPAAATWPALQAKVAAKPGLSRAGGPTNWPVWLGAAAALLLATLIGLVPMMNRGHDDDQAAGDAPAAAVTVESVAAEFEAAETHYQKAIDDLQTIANADTGELDPQIAAVLQKNLTVIDQAISENRAALKSQPGSANAQEGLFSALTTKVALLQRTVQLINEMRKGNQAEAGRKIQTLSQ